MEGVPLAWAAICIQKLHANNWVLAGSLANQKAAFLEASQLMNSFADLPFKDGQSNVEDSVGDIEPMNLVGSELINSIHNIPNLVHNTLIVGKVH